MVTSSASRDGLSPARPAGGARWSCAAADRGRQAAGAPRDPAPAREPHARPRADHRRPLGRGRSGLGSEDGADPRLAAAQGASRTTAAHPRVRATCSRWATTSSTWPGSSALSPTLAMRSRRAMPRKARELLGEALALWRGPALAEFSEPFARHEGARLEELRLAALEWRIEADLALGHHRDVVGELEALIAEHPLRERVRSQHMLALYRSGRHAEALAELPGVSADACRRAGDRAVCVASRAPSGGCSSRIRRSSCRPPRRQAPSRSAPDKSAGVVGAGAARRRRLRAQRRRPDRLPDRRRRAARPRSRPRLGLHLPAGLGEPEAGRLLPAAGVDGAAHPL